MNEECGLVIDDIQVVDNNHNFENVNVFVESNNGMRSSVYIDEVCIKTGLPLTRYFISILKKPISDVQLIAQDINEILSCGFYTINQAFNMLTPSRKTVLEIAYNFILTHLQKIQ